MTSDSIKETLRAHGGADESVRLLDWDSADLLVYATLASARRERSGDLQALCGIYEWQQQPLAFLADGQLIEGPEQLLRMRRLLAMRGGAPYFVLIRGASLSVYSVGLDNATEEAARIKLPTGMQASQVVPYLSNGRPGTSGRRRWIEQVVLSLLDDAITRLINDHQVSSVEAISLVGRALFVRFLADRSLFSDNDAQRIAGVRIHELFDEASSVSKVSAWLDETFNGDLLPLPEDAVRRLGTSSFTILGNILRRAPGGQLHLDWYEDWAHLDFAYIPVGVLSQAYECFLRSHDEETQKSEGGYYTPAPIAQMMLRGAMHALDEQGRAHTAKVLDPAVGAGVFIISAFRQLVAARWNAEQVRPDTATLRSILYEQIAGFDVNEEALRFAALGLYLISIELDPNPRPVQKLKFEHNLRGRVLFKVGEHGSAGSLGTNVDVKHDGHYDLIIGNPPWSSSTKLDEWPEITERVREIAKDRLLNEPFRPLLPNEVMDLPFVWRSMRWCREGGQIALVLHARWLFQQGDGMPEARNAIFSALDITGIVNGADLRNSRVWPEIGAPFCLVFARNVRPTSASSFRFVSPRREDALNAAGMFRIDALNSPQLTRTQVIAQPDVLKVLYRGGQIDLELLNRMKGGGTTIDSYWRSLGETNGKATWSGNGYQRLRDSSPVNKEDGLRGIRTAHLMGKPHLVASRHLPVLLNAQQLPEFDQERVHRVRSPEQYKGPLLLVHKSPPAGIGRLNVAVCDDDLVYNQSFYGYSAANHDRGQDLVRFMALVIGSKPTLWYSLLTSGEFGFERETIEKSTIDSIRVPCFDELSNEDLRNVRELFDEVEGASREALPNAWKKVDAWVASHYGLRPVDAEAMADTLMYNSPFAENRKAAQQRPHRVLIDRFVDALKHTLRPLAERFGLNAYAALVPLPIELPWLLIRVSGGSCETQSENLMRDIEGLLHMADGLGTTEVQMPLQDGSLLVALLSQSRYWTVTQARLLARRIVWEHRQHLFRGNA